MVFYKIMSLMIDYIGILVISSVCNVAWDVEKGRFSYLCRGLSDLEC